MTIMRRKFFRLVVLLAGSFLCASFAYADVLKCREAGGGISYTNGLCMYGAQPERIIADDTSAPPSPVYSAPQTSISKQTAWATRTNATPRHRPDVESIRIARLNMLAIDRLPPAQRRLMAP
jgi:hypothetical protein